MLQFVTPSNHEEWKFYHRVKKEQIFLPRDLPYDKSHPYMTNPNHFHYVIYDKDLLVGMLHLDLWTKEVGILRVIAIDAPYQGRALGKAIMAFVEHWFHDKNVKQIKMHAVLNAEGFYRKLGYKEVEFHDYTPCTDIINLGKTLY